MEKFTNDSKAYKQNIYLVIPGENYNKVQLILIGVNAKLPT